MLVLLDCKNLEDKEMLVAMPKNQIVDCFQWLAPWGPDKIPKHRLVWLRCFVPLSIWESSVFRQLASRQGSVVEVCHETSNRLAFEYGRICILSSSSGPIFDLFDIVVDGAPCSIKLVEEPEGCHSPSCGQNRGAQKIGIDFKNVHTVINFDMPQTAAGYVHRIGRTGRAHNTGASVSLVSPDEMEVLGDIKSILGENDSEDRDFIAPFPLLSKNAVEPPNNELMTVTRRGGIS